MIRLEKHYYLIGHSESSEEMCNFSSFCSAYLEREYPSKKEWCIPISIKGNEFSYFLNPTSFESGDLLSLTLVYVDKNNTLQEYKTKQLYKVL